MPTYIYDHQFLQSMPVAVYTCDAQGYILSYNEASVSLWGRVPDIGKDLWCGSWKIYYTDGTPVPLGKCPMALALKEGLITHPEIIIEKPDGEKRHIMPYPQPLYNADGKLEGGINTLIDITEQAIARKKMEEIEMRSRLALDAAEMGSFDWDMQNDMLETSPRLNQIFGFSMHKTVRNTEFFSTFHPDDIPAIDKAIKEAFTKGSMVYEARIIWADNSVHWVKVYGKIMFGASQKPQRMYGTVLDITDEKYSAEVLEQKVKERTAELHDKNNFVQTLLDSSVDMIIVLDKDLRFILFNKTAEDIFKQYIPESLLGKTIEEVDPDIKEKESYADMTACLRGDTIHRKAVKSSAADRYFDLDYVPIKNDEETYAVMLITREVTESVFAKQAMEEVNAKLTERNKFVETIIDVSQNYITVYDTETRLVSINLSAEKLVGGKREEMIGKKLLELFPEAKGTKGESDLLRAIDGEFIKNELYLSPVSHRYIQNYLSPLRDVNGKVYAVLITAYDMTEIKKSEEEIKHINYQLTKAQRLAHLGSWEWDIVNNIITWTDELYRIFGVNAAEYENSFENYMNAVHPEDKDYAAKIVEDAIKSQIPFDFIHRIIDTAGTVRTLHAKGEVFTNSNNETILLAGTAQDITESVEMEHRLKQSEIRHHLMIDQIEDYAIIFLNAEGYIEDWNKGAEKIKGYSAEEIIGKHFSVFYTKEELKEDLPERLLAEAVKNKRVAHEGWRIRKDGSRFWANVLITALKSDNNQLIGFSKLTRDLTEQKIVEEQIKSQTEKVIEQNALLEKINNELANQKAFAELLIESNPLMILSYDKNFVINTWNKKSEEHSSLKKEHVLGKKMFEVFAKYNTEEWIKSNDEVLKEGKSLYFPKIKFNYQRGWGESFVIPLRDTRNEIIGLLSITKDITEMVKMNEEIEKKNQDLEKMNKELASFSYIASHDLQEPLRKILTFSSRLVDKHKSQLSDESLALLNKIEGSALRMKTLIQSLLEYSRLVTQENMMEPTDLNEIVRDVINDFELLIEQKKAKIKKSKLPVVHAIPLQMNQLFYNLFSNALKFSRDGTAPLISITTHQLTDKEIRSNDLLNPKMHYCEIVFSDNGIGFDQKFAEKIFITFQRLNSANDYPGTGIGLALSKKIVENHEGVIYAESEVDKGSVFHIILPVQKTEKKIRKK